jgi:hypothetical protein
MMSDTDSVWSARSALIVLVVTVMLGWAYFNGHEWVLRPLKLMWHFLHASLDALLT